MTPEEREIILQAARNKPAETLEAPAIGIADRVTSVIKAEAVSPNFRTSIVKHYVTTRFMFFLAAVGVFLWLRGFDSVRPGRVLCAREYDVSLWHRGLFRRG